MDSFLTRSAKKLEQALGVPRPWELTPATSVGYQMATGEGPMGERARKGAAQFIGRYATNIKKPWGYDLPSITESPQWIRSVLTDAPPFMTNASSDVTRDTLSREMFDLPQRSDSSRWITKTGPKTYEFPQGEGGYGSLSAFRESTIPNAPEYMKTHPILGNVALKPIDDKYRYEDVWDIVSPSDIERTDISARLRKLIAPILRPATVSGKVPAP
jgi:hypothetical protein